VSKKIFIKSFNSECFYKCGFMPFRFPGMKEVHTLQAHPANCICIEFHPLGKYFAVGAADAVVSLWDLEELACVRTFTSLDWPVRAISFSGDGVLLASASEDLTIDISHVETGEKVVICFCARIFHSYQLIVKMLGCNCLEFRFAMSLLKLLLLLWPLTPNGIFLLMLVMTKTNTTEIGIVVA